MPQIAVISIDEVGPPAVAVELTPQSIQGNLATYYDTSLGVPALFPKLTQSLTRPSKGVKNSRVRVRIEMPVSNGLEPAAYSYSNFADVTFTFDEKSSEEERLKLFTVFDTVMGHASTQAMIQGLNFVY